MCDALQAFLAGAKRTKRTTNDEAISLVVRARCGDDSAIDELVNRNIGLVVSIASKGFHGDWDALLEDIQEGVIALWEAATHYDPSVSTARFSSYAGTAIRNRVWLQARRRRADRLRPMEDAEELPNYRESGDMDERWIAAYRAIERLPDEERRLVCQHFGLGEAQKSFREMGRTIGRSHEVARRRVNVAIERLRELVTE